MRVYDYMCERLHRWEAFVKDADEAVFCPTCGCAGTRQLSAPRSKLEGFTGAFPGAAMKWEKNRESHMKKEQKHMDSHGTYWLDK